MKQSSLVQAGSNKRTRKREFLDSMDRVVPWADLVSLIEPPCPPKWVGAASALLMFK